ncbi:MAG: 16S rRNA (uracil(1498)-N(3))-methyltransferase, partial [Proteobacteria bacterium]
MNLLLFDDTDLISQGLLKVQGRRARHIIDVHRSKLGDTVRVGKIGSDMGSGLITKLDSDSVEISFTLTTPPPAKLPLTLFLALPRPKFLSKCLQTATTLGVSRIVLMNAYKVEKVYWSCEQISLSSVRESCLLGLEQA